MRRLASCLLVAPWLALTAMGAACGGDSFTAESGADRDGAAEASLMAGDGSTGPSTDGASGLEASSEAAVDAGPRPDADAHADAGAPGDASGQNTGCPAGRGPAMVLVDGFCIDATEVTSAQYNAFLLSGPSLTGQPAECSWNTSYLPGNGWVFAAAQGTWPIANVNWCDALAFCKWAGKRLCGKLGGGSADFSQFAASDNEHYLACSDISTRVYPYGNAFDPTACNGPERDAGHVLPVGSLAGCQGGVPGLFDMSGNVEEWQDACNGNAGAGDMCLDGTGAFNFGDPPDGTRCDFSDSDSRNAQYDDVGIRCCATPP